MSLKSFFFGQLAGVMEVAVHAFGGAKHSASTLAELNSKITDADVDDDGDPRDPNAHVLDPGTGPHTGTTPEATVVFSGTGHAHSGAADGKAVAHADTSGQTVNDHHNEAHDIDPAAGPHTGGLPEASSEFDDSSGHAHTGAAGNGTVIAHSDTTGKTADDHHAHANKAQIDLVTDGDHDVRTDNPHSVTAAQADAYTKAEVDVLVDATMKAPEAFAPSGTYPVTYGGAAVEKGDSFRITSAGTMGARTVNIEDLLIALIDTPAQVDANWMVAESNRDQATETVKGVAELATQAEADAGTNDTNIITPLKMATAPVNQHGLGSGSAHSSATVAQLNALVSDATLDDDDAPRPADEIITTTGPTTMPVGAVADGEFLKRSGAAIIGAPLNNDIQLSWADVNTIANDYAVAARFMFRGTGVLGTPASMKVAVVMSGANTGDIKIFDFTNSLEIVEKTGISNTAIAIIDLGALSNLPAAEAVFELQIRVPAVGAVSISVFSLGVFF